jgi:cytochrome P450
VKEEVLDLVRGEITDRRQRLDRGEAPDDLVSLMAAAEGREGITRSVVVDNVFSFVLGSLETTERWIGNCIVRLSSDPELRGLLNADHSQIERFADEVMRVDTVAQVIMRRVKPDGAELGGKQLKGGDPIYVMLGAANADPAQFEHAGKFDMQRTRKLNLGFGFGMHHCLGINIARREAIAFIAVLLEKFPDYVVDECDYGDTWALWGPRRLLVSRSPGSAAT